jgi:nucleoside-diphosphate-sugar epimerase
VPNGTLVAVTHADGPLGSRVAARLEAEPGTTVVRIGGDLGGERGDELKRTLHGATAVVHLAADTEAPLEPARQVLEAASDAAVGRLVVVGSALVYGAWPTNPVPLTDDAALRPNPDFLPAVALGEVERLVADWADAHPSASVAVLRTAVPVADDATGWLASMLASVRGVSVGEDDPPFQFVHVDDIASAVAVALSSGLAGAANVAPEGWISGEELRGLAGGPRVRVPFHLGERLTSWRWRAGISPTPPGILPWTVHPWVVSADRLRSLGWSAEHSNQEAFVAGHKALPWATVSPRRRQELTLGVSAAAVAAGAAAAVALVRRARRAG